VSAVEWGGLVEKALADLAWPATVTIGVVLLKQQLGTILVALGQRVTKIKIGGNEIELTDKVLAASAGTAPPPAPPQTQAEQDVAVEREQLISLTVEMDDTDEDAPGSGVRQGGASGRSISSGVAVGTTDSASARVRSGLHDVDASQFKTPQEMVEWIHQSLVWRAKARMLLDEPEPLPRTAISLGLPEAQQEAAVALQELYEKVRIGAATSWTDAVNYAAVAAAFDEHVIANAYKRRPSHA